MRHPACLCYALGKMDEKNKLYFGDNLRILRDYVPDASVDLIYLAPPFSSAALQGSTCWAKAQRYFSKARSSNTPPTALKPSPKPSGRRKPNRRASFSRAWSGWRADLVSKCAACPLGDSNCPRVNRQLCVIYYRS